MRTWEGLPDRMRAGGSFVQSQEEAHAAWVCAGEKLTESWACKGLNEYGRPLPGMAGPSTAELSMTEPSMAGACMVFCVDRKATVPNMCKCGFLHESHV